jgi:hypothetical protein
MRAEFVASEVSTHHVGNSLPMVSTPVSSENKGFALAPVLRGGSPMVRTSGAFVILGTLVLGACGVGDGAPPTDNRDEKLGILCNATFTTTGTFAAGLPGRPIDETTGTAITGCWPVGTWTFSAKVDTNECDTQPALAGSYAFKVDRAVDPDPLKDIGYFESYTYLGDQAALFKLDVSSVASGCEGAVELYSADGTEYWNLRPLLQDNGSIVGFGEYAKYDSSQR